MSFSSQVLRKFMTSCQMLGRLPKRVTPGLRNQLNAIEDAAEVIQSDPEGFEGLESDLFNVHRSHKEHEVEMKRQREKIKMHLIKNKYFRKDSLPNLLTYAEKEHIRYLHSCDEEEWTVDKLAESFPANAEVISKIIKSRWNPISSKRILLHDTGVMKNWERFKNGEYKTLLSKNFDEHLQKFADRNINEIKVLKDSIKILPKKQWQKPNSKEFSSIISSLNKRNSDTKKNTLLEGKTILQEISPETVEDETYLKGEIKDKKHITIHQLKSRQLGKRNGKFASNENKNSLDQLLEQKERLMSETGILTNKSDSTRCHANNFNNKFMSNEITIKEFDRKLYGISETKHRIHIPRKLWQKGATYRANNCYYHDDGEFLYEVPMPLK